MNLSEIDVMSSAAYVDGVPHQQFAYLREHAPVHLQRNSSDPTLVPEAWVLSGVAEIQRVSEDTDTFISGGGITLRDQLPSGVRRLDSGNFIVLDDPAHRRLRLMVATAFTPRVVHTFTEHYGALTARVLADALAKEEFDFVTEVAAELPLLAICELIGAPETDRADIFRWSNAVLGADDPEYAGTLADAGRAAVAIGKYALDLADRKRTDPGEDILSKLANAPEVRRLTDAELEGFILLLLVAGNETTRNNITHGLIALLEHPEQLAALRAKPAELLDDTVEEITRWASPVNYMARTATRDTVLGGKQIREGDKVAMFYGSANRDEKVFPGGDSFDITHRYPRHYAFGIGKHFCLGAHLARIETRTVLAELLAATTDIRAIGGVERQRSSFINGVKHFRVAAKAA